MACLLVILCAGCLAAALQYRKYRWAVAAALGTALALLMAVLYFMYRCCCSNSVPGFEKLQPRQRKRVMCSADSAPLEPPPASRGPLYPIPEPSSGQRSEVGPPTKRMTLCTAEQAPLMPRPKDFGPLYPAPPSSAELALRSQYGEARVKELMKLRRSEVVKRAAAAGATETEVDDTIDSTFPKEATVELLLRHLATETDCAAESGTLG